MNYPLKADEVRNNALKEAQRLHKEAQEKGDPELYDEAAHYYLAAGGHNKDANDCYEAADVLRRAAQS